MRIKKIVIIGLINFLLINSANSQSQDEISELINHANTHIWLGRNWNNALPEFQKASVFVDSAWVQLEKSSIDSLVKLNLAKRLLAFDQELDEMKAICIDNMNGRYPLYMNLMGNIDNYEKLDEPIEIACEKALGILLSTNTFKPSKPLKDLMCFAVVETEPYNPTLEEVCHQFIVNNSNTYAISRHELATIFGDVPNKFGQVELMKVQEYFDTKNVGKFKIKIHDQFDGIYYVGANFDLIEPDKMTIHSHSYSDGFIVDKRGIIAKAITNSIVPIVMYAIVFGLFIFLVLILVFKEPKSSLMEILTAFGGFNVGVVLSAAVSFVLLLLCRTYAPTPGDFYLSGWGQLWRITIPLLFGLVAPSVTVLTTTFLTKKIFVRTKRSTAMLWAGSALGGLVPLGFFYYEFHEARMSNLVLGWTVLTLLLAGTISGWQYFIWTQKSRSMKRLISCILSLLPGFGIFLFLIEDHNSLSMWFYLLPAVLFFPMLLSFFKTTGIIKLFDRFTAQNRDKNSSSSPGRTAALSHLVNDTIAANFDRPSVPFKQGAEKQIVDALKTVQGDKRIGLVSVRGNRGIGKTTIIKKVIAELTDAGKIDHCFYGDCDEFQDGNTVPYEPFVEAFGETMGEGAFLRADRQAQELLSKLKPGLQETAIGNMALSFVSDQSFAGASLHEVTKVFEVYFSKWIEQTKRLGSSLPVFVFVLEDIQWIDRDSLQLFKRLIGMILKLKKRSEFEFVILVSERVGNNTDGKTNENYDDFSTFIGDKSVFKKESIIYSDDADSSVLVESDFFDKFITNSNIAFNYNSRKAISSHFADQNYFNPAQILESLNYVIVHHWLDEINGEIVLKKEASLKNLPLPRQLRELYAEKFDLLDKDLRRLLETAAFIGASFEANTLARIWKIDRLELLHMLRTAEDMGLIIDLSEKDDVYKFTSKNLVSELKKYASKHEYGENQPQIVKEYHKQIVEIMLNEKNIDPLAYDLSIVCQLADRTFKLKDYMVDKAIELNLAAVKRNFSSGSIELAKKYLENLIGLSNASINVGKNTIIQIKLLQLKILLTNDIEFADELNRELIDLFILEDSSELKRLYEEFYLVYMSIMNTHFVNSKDEKLKSEIERSMGSKNLPFQSRFLDVISKFYSILFSYPAVIDSKKRFDEFEKFRWEMIETNDTTHPIYGRVLNELGRNCPDRSETKYYRDRIQLILNNIGCTGCKTDDEAAIPELIALIRNNYSRLTYPDKEDINYSMGSWARTEFQPNENYEISLDMNRCLKEWNLLLGAYQGYSIASLYVGLCCNAMYATNAKKELYSAEPFLLDWFNNYEDCYYELGGLTSVGNKNTNGKHDQYFHLCRWIESMGKISDPSEIMTNRLSGAVSDFVAMCSNERVFELTLKFTGKAADEMFQIEKRIKENNDLIDKIPILSDLFSKVSWVKS
jgi:hypothetical protein